MRTLYENGRVYTGQLPLTEAFVVEDAGLCSRAARSRPA